MASCMVLYATGDVQVAEAMGGDEYGAWLASDVDERTREVTMRFGRVRLGYGVTVWSMDGWGPAERIQAWAEANGVLAVQVNGVTVWPFPES